MPSLARSVPKPLKVPSLARSVPKPLKVPSFARSVPKPLKVPNLARSVLAASFIVLGKIKKIIKVSAEETYPSPSWKSQFQRLWHRTCKTRHF